jgi:release factor glutamine methyltransferase
MTRQEEWVLREKYTNRAEAGFETDKERLANGEPVAYVIGWQPFLGMKIYLDSKPLIPRIETEWWTEQILKEMRGANFRFLDLCAGSGAIGCAVLNTFPNAQISFSEIDPSHETTIRKNLRKNGLDESRATLYLGDLFDPLGDMRFDYIAINPPYIPEGRALPKSVTAYEPALALRAGVDGLEYIRKIAALLPYHLIEGGKAWIECDSAHAEAARSLCAATGLESRIIEDQFGRPRVIVISFPQ